MNKLEKFKSMLSQGNLVFVKDFTAMNFVTNMGILAIDVNYTNDEKDTFVTPMLKEIGHNSADFENEEEYFEFIEWLQDNGIPQKRT